MRSDRFCFFFLFPFYILRFRPIWHTICCIFGHLSHKMLSFVFQRKQWTKHKKIKTHFHYARTPRNSQWIVKERFVVFFFYFGKMPIFFSHGHNKSNDYVEGKWQNLIYYSNERALHKFIKWQKIKHTNDSSSQCNIEVNKEWVRQIK